MAAISALYYRFQRGLFDYVQYLDGLPALALRLYLVPIFWMAGSMKIDFTTLMPYESTVAWFGNPDWLVCHHQHPSRTCH